MIRRGKLNPDNRGQVSNLPAAARLRRLRFDRRCPESGILPDLIS